MKKLALIIAVAGIVGMSSCSKGTDVVCTFSVLGIKTTATVGEEEVEICAASLPCQTTGLGGVTQDAYVKTLEQGGYKCK